MVVPNSDNNVYSQERELPFSAIEPLINEPYTYDNMMNNPIIKPISEVDRSLRDLDEMINKMLIDSRRDKQWVNAAIEDVPSYQDSPFVSRIIELTKNTQNIIKLQDIEIKNLKNAIREIVEIVKEKYGVRVDEEQYADVETIVPEQNYGNYLLKLMESGDRELAEVAKQIKGVFDRDRVSRDEKQRYQNACAEVYKNEAEKPIKDMIARIMRMEYE